MPLTNVKRLAFQLPCLQTRVILVPVNMGKHWTVMAIFPKHRVMLYLDSLWSPATRVFQWFFSYVETLFEIWNEALDLENSCDSVWCGAVMLTLAFHFSLPYGCECKCNNEILYDHSRADISLI